MPSSAESSPGRMDVALLLLRLGLAAITLPYGVVKLLTFADRVAFLAGLGSPAPAAVMAVNLSLELAAGVLYLTGIGMGPAALLLVANTLAILTPINWTADPLEWWSLVLLRLSAAAALALLGPGRYAARR